MKIIRFISVVVIIFVNVVHNSSQSSKSNKFQSTTKLTTGKFKQGESNDSTLLIVTKTEAKKSELIWLIFNQKKLKTVREVVFITQINVVHMLITVTNNQKKIPRTLAITANLKVWNTTWTLKKSITLKSYKISCKTKLKLKKWKLSDSFQ